jgi:hypothetical protein
MYPFVTIRGLVREGGALVRLLSVFLAVLGLSGCSLLPALQPPRLSVV